MITVEPTKLDGVCLIRPNRFGDNRGWFMESYSKKDFEEAGLHYEFVQDNRSFTERKGTVRGLHFQRPPMAQAKLLSCLRGSILDVAVDLRPDSPTYKDWVGVILTAEDPTQLLIPRGFAHGFVTLTDNVEFQYKVDNFYSPEHDGGIRWNDPDIGVEWGVSDPILSEKDMKSPFLRELGPVF
ncbi:MAG: dTDP-4-dehydrorhamnose 3,5-epimerase [Clostridia bacterium]|nr:dTDP-4-dehydrorhamnose 3,5-epimerase [Clostridia bacterium]